MGFVNQLLTWGILGAHIVEDAPIFNPLQGASNQGALSKTQFHPFQDLVTKANIGKGLKSSLCQRSDVLSINIFFVPWGMV